MNTAANATKTPTHTATLKGETIQFHFEDFQMAVDALVARHGGGVPKIDTIVEMKPVAVLAPVAKKLAIGEYDAEGDARSQVDRDAAKEAGFSPANPVYRQGSRATGMRQFREAFDKLPLAQSAALALEKTVADEHRKDETVTQIALRMDNQGRLAIGARRMPFGSRRAFGSLVARLGMPAGAATYLPAVEPTTRAMNVNRWTTGPLTAAEDARKEACTVLNEKFEPETVVIRTRDNANKDREVYGLVSEGYGDFDADKIAEAIRLAVPTNARATVAYDGTRTKFDVVFFSNIVPEDAVAGEFFQAAVQIRTDDTGGWLDRGGRGHPPKPLPQLHHSRRRRAARRADPSRRDDREARGQVPRSLRGGAEEDRTLHGDVGLRGGRRRASRRRCSSLARRGRSRTKRCASTPRCRSARCFPGSSTVSSSATWCRSRSEIARRRSTS